MMKNRMIGKVIALAITFAVLMVGLMLISDVVRDRIRNHDRAVQGIVNSTAGQQTIYGPVLAQTCVKEVQGKDSDGKPETRFVTTQRFAMPDDLSHAATAHMQPLMRGLHQVNTYVLNSEITARFAAGNQLRSLPTEPGVHKCGAPVVMLPISDPRGIRSANLQWNGAKVALASGTGHKTYVQGLHAVQPATAADSNGDMEIRIQLELLGTERVGFVPLGNNNQVSLAADWPHPSFGGNFLPSQREVQDKRFDARWNISSLASSAQQSFIKGRGICNFYETEYTNSDNDCMEQFSTSFIDPINPYSLSDRATKYGLLFVVLTFVAVAMFEILKQLRVHPVQYLLVGSALCSFFLLLISLSEHIGFAQAYAVAASACVLLLGYYASHILGSVKRGLPFAAMIAVMYGLLYVLLQLEQTALVVGSIALFAVLALVMVCTRKVDWYAFGKGDAPPSAAPDVGSAPAAMAKPFDTR